MYLATKCIVFSTITNIIISSSSLRPTHRVLSLAVTYTAREYTLCEESGYETLLTVS